ncbi:MAG: carboxylesterase [Bacillota bacterium]|jgi:pimeloyl-ACP methyl ester carboxylesterase
MAEKRVNINGINIYVETFGQKTQPAILLVSGAMAPRHIWSSNFCQKLVVAGYFVIRYDHRDIGLSDSIDYDQHSYDLQDLAHDALMMLDLFKIKQAHVVGHSMGGLIAQLLALDHPTRLLSITLISSPVLAKVELNEEEQQALANTWEVMLQNKPTATYQESVQGFLEVYSYLHGDLPLDQTMAKAYVKTMYAESTPQNLAWFEKFSLQKNPHNHVRAQSPLENRSGELSKMGLPVLIIHGQKDTLAFSRIINRYFVKLPNVTVKIMPGMGHMIFNEALFKQIKELIIDHTHKDTK